MSCKTETNENEKKGSFCFTENKTIIVRYLNKYYIFIFDAAHNCTRTAKGEFYVGMVDTSINNRTCLPWNDVLHAVGRNGTYWTFPGGNSSGSYCRNPDGRGGGPWCFVLMDGTAETCDVSNCSE